MSNFRGKKKWYLFWKYIPAVFLVNALWRVFLQVVWSQFWIFYRNTLHFSSSQVWSLILILLAFFGWSNLSLKAYLFLFSFPTQPNGAMLLWKKMRHDVYFIASRHSDSKIVSETGSSFYVNQRIPFFRALLPQRAEPLSLRWWKNLKEMKRIRSVERVNHLCCWG